MKKINLLLILFYLLASCKSLDDAGKVLRNEKTRSTDEFLVKKKEPLVMPPNFDEIPEPSSKIKKEQNEDEKIKKILNAPKTKDISKNKSTTIEDSILNKIKK